MPSKMLDINISGFSIPPYAHTKTGDFGPRTRKTTRAFMTESRYFRSLPTLIYPRNAITQPQTTVLLELEKILQTCHQMYSPNILAIPQADDRNKLLVQSVEVARGPHILDQKKAVAGVEVWKRVVEERVDVVDEEMDVDG